MLANNLKIMHLPYRIIHKYYYSTFNLTGDFLENN